MVFSRDWVVLMMEAWVERMKASKSAAVGEEAQGRWHLWGSTCRLCRRMDDGGIDFG